MLACVALLAFASAAQADAALRGADRRGDRMHPGKTLLPPRSRHGGQSRRRGDRRRGHIPGDLCPSSPRPARPTSRSTENRAARCRGSPPPSVARDLDCLGAGDSLSYVEIENDANSGAGLSACRQHGSNGSGSGSSATPASAATSSRTARSETASSASKAAARAASGAPRWPRQNLRVGAQRDGDRLRQRLERGAGRIQRSHPGELHPGTEELDRPGGRAGPEGRAGRLRDGEHLRHPFQLRHVHPGRRSQSHRRRWQPGRSAGLRRCRKRRLPRGRRARRRSTPASPTSSARSTSPATRASSGRPPTSAPTSSSRRRRRPLRPRRARSSRSRSSPAIFRAGNVAGAIASRRKKPTAPLGTTVSYSLSAAASVSFTLQKLTTGRKVGKKCVKQTSQNEGHGKCPLAKPVKGSFSQSGVAGQNTFKFSGRIGGRSLAPGRYELVASAAAPSNARRSRSSNSAPTTTRTRVSVPARGARPRGRSGGRRGPGRRDRPPPRASRRRWSR